MLSPVNHGLKILAFEFVCSSSPSPCSLKKTESSTTKSALMPFSDVTVHFSALHLCAAQYAAAATAIASGNANYGVILLSISGSLPDRLVTAVYVPRVMNVYSAVGAAGAALVDHYLHLD
uniref:Uncharacterized protein n=1 Tax=Melanopsichium pennsylvanicum 4 TaxID=1398559 RepID=A0A077QUY1_9BASI|nr:uncharacterized protein BN887_06132 [Melanopsichium pennsylvanicum 4]